MKRLRRPKTPHTIHEFAAMLNDPQNTNYASTLQIIPSTFFQQELIVNGISVAVVFANIDAIHRYCEELASVELVGVDATYE
jgi:hypothetical protein